MPNDLKSVGLSFKADGAVDFKKSLSEVNNAVNENRSAFKLAKSEWDKGTSSAEKLRATQEYLQNQTETYTAKVDRLTEILKAQESAEIRDEAAISKTRQQLDNAKASLNNYKSGLEDVNKKLESGAATLEDYSKKVQGFSDKTGQIGSSLNKNVTAPVAAAAGGVMAAWSQVDEGMDIVAQKTGATGDALKQMQYTARNVATSIPTDFETAGSAVGEVNTRFHLTGKELEDLSMKFVEFSSLNDTDVSSSIDSVQKALEAFGLGAEDAGAMLDTMNKVGQDTGISMDSLSQLMVTNAASLKELGMSAADAATFLGQCETSGVDTSAVMTGLKKALTNASGEGKTMKEALSELQNTMLNAETSADAYNAAVDLFGSKAGPALAEFCKDGKLNFEDLGASLNDNLWNVEDTFNNTVDPVDRFKTSLNALKYEGYEVGNVLGPVLVECLQTVLPILYDLEDSWNSLSPGTQEMIIKCALLAAALGPVFSIVSKVSGGISSVISVGAKVAPVISKAKTAFGAFNAILAANPVLRVAIAVTTLIAILVTLYNKCEWFRNGVNAAFGGIKSFIAGVVDSIKGFLSFDWKLPKIKLPHFKIKGGFSLTPPKTPKFSVDWYAKGGILNSPTIFGSNGNSLMGGGEAGKEAVLPIDLLRSYIREENQGNNEVLAQMIAEAMSRIPLTVENNIQLGDKKLADVLVDAIIKKMSQSVKWKKGAVGA
ncbi:phage tail tape measure protein [Dorea longicatena]|uniref:phage tail tape measure protein n=1 Tax=Dorea longicatena TaxID=88431 RepID=UPI003F89ABE7